MTNKSEFFQKVYALDDPEKTRDLYKEWARTYDDEVRANGYASPSRTASAMAEAVADLSAPLLDIGCGTGLSGEALSEVGFSTIDGTDFSEEMLNAAATKDLYRSLIKGDFNRPLPAGENDYVNFTAIGVFSPGHGMPDLIGTVVDRMPLDGCFGFSLNDHALQDPGYVQTIEQLVDAGDVALIFDDYGDHLPGLGSKSKVCVLRKL